ncbi:hypothetical protein PoB_005535800 [Plakobranchus ocellatus]|uniref:Uncharacterized protein n=1 Tax=Plakobranchus ocellatus TaxID=259542 RepID=A0AAV4CAF2_9GAST|nr:hypothetical protein PoB_005535800 [Plakobranchus ocellatus]
MEEISNQRLPLQMVLVASGTLRPVSIPKQQVMEVSITTTTRYLEGALSFPSWLGFFLEMSLAKYGYSAVYEQFSYPEQAHLYVGHSL